MARRSALATWLHQLDPADLEKILLRRADAAETQPHTLRRLADELSVVSSVRRAVDALDQGCLDVLNTALHLGEGMSVEVLAKALRVARQDRGFTRALARLRESALLWPIGEGCLRTIGGLRPIDAPPERITPAPPPARRSDRVGTCVEDSASAPASSTVDGVTRLVELCDAQAVAVRRYGGGIGIRELRRMASVLHADEQRVRLWVELAVHAELLAVEEPDRRALVNGGETPQHLLPSTTSDDWRAAPPARRLVDLVRAWPRMNWAPATAKPRSALADQVSDLGAAIRAGVLTRFAEEPDTVVVNVGDVVAELSWRVPAVHNTACTAAAVAEAEALGLVSLGCLTELGRALLVDEGVEEAADRLIPPATGVARFQADLTAVVSGLPTAPLSALLDSVAESDERDTASVWRFSAESVRRALDGGRDADRLLAELAAVAENELPQPLTHLVRDVERRHGQVTVTPVACCVRTADPGLFDEIAQHRSLRCLELVVLGPGVLASSKSAEETLDALRAAGYAPTSSDPAGAPIIGRVERRRIVPNRPKPVAGRPHRRTPLTRTEASRLAADLIQREQPEPPPPPKQAESRRISTARTLRDQSLFLPDAEVVLLAEALVAGTSVEIQVASGPRRTVGHVITPVGHASGNLTATTDGGPREFPVSHIRSVRALG
ncbi:helicase-associated domain-containing protein [Umezawaea sp.]|uniref:helicase-associated domain-containing protein n=1 Tax=Umezawaea sp. TaxID=1955258 RepID=UPI002ED1244A